MVEDGKYVLDTKLDREDEAAVMVLEEDEGAYGDDVETEGPFKELDEDMVTEGLYRDVDVESLERVTEGAPAELELDGLTVGIYE